MMSDYSTLGSFATGGASALNGDLLQRLYDADYEVKVAPIEKSLELMDSEDAKVGEINTKVNELLDSIKAFDLYNPDGTAFDTITASTTGDSAVFDASNINQLKPGVINVQIDQIAQNDAYQSITYTDPDAELSADGSGDKITINGIDFSTEGRSLNELANDINVNGSFSASVVQVSDTESRLIIKSVEPGEANTLDITQTGIDMGFEDDTDSDGDGVADNHILVAQNLIATVDGVDYNLSSNSITIDDNLKITAVTTGASSISVQSDDSYVIPALEDFATKYNELVDMIDEELYSPTTSIQNTSSLKNMLSEIKNTMFESFGLEDNNLFTNGFSFDEYGKLSIDTDQLGQSLIDDPEGMRDLFIGVPEDEGFGTKLKAQLDSYNAYDGLFINYADDLSDRRTNLEEEKEKTIKDLDDKYDAMAASWAAYGSIITQMESSFSGLDAIINAENNKD